MPFDPDGTLLSKDEWERRKGEWLPTDADRAYVATLQKPVTEVGQDRELDRQARPRHQGTALRVRVRPAGLIGKG